MQAGQLRHRITLQQPKPGHDSVTDDSGEWVDVATRPAMIRPVSVKEIYAGQGYVGQQDVVMVIRYEPQFDVMNYQWRLFYQNRKYEVVGVMNVDMKDRWLKILTHRDQGDLRIKNPDFDGPLNHTVHTVIAGVVVMIQPAVRLEGLAALEQALRNLTSEDQIAGAKVIRSALMSASLPMYRDMQHKAPVSPQPDIRKRATKHGPVGSPKYRMRKSKKSGWVEIRPGFLKMKVRRRSYINKTGHGNRNISGSGLVKVRLGAFTPYAYMQEHGTDKAAAHPFVRPAFDAHWQATVQRFSVLLGRRLDTAQRKYAPMILEQGLFDYLKAHIQASVYAQLRGDRLPAVVYTLISDPVTVSTPGVEQVHASRYQIDCYHRKYLQVKTVSVTSPDRPATCAGVTLASIPSSCACLKTGRTAMLNRLACTASCWSLLFTTPDR